MANILIIDDDKLICEYLANVLKMLDHDVVFKQNLDDGVQECSEKMYDIVFLDVHFPDGNGLDTIPVLQESIGTPDIIIITGVGDPNGAELAINSGAWDYLQKPMPLKALQLTLRRVLDFRKEKNKTPLLSVNLEGIVGDCAKFSHCLNLLSQAASCEANTLISGETGTGKELFARAIHDNSDRCGKDFVVVDCASLPENLVESTLFGHTKGAFTNADKDRDGLIKIANGGTLFLDEIGELPLVVQSVFLRALQEKTIRAVGSNAEFKSDFRLIAATNCDLEEKVREGLFRQDLLYRIRTIQIYLPSLRERKKDVIKLAMHFMYKYCDKYKIPIKGFSQELLEILSLYSWPGNIRELENIIENIITSSGDSSLLFPEHLPVYMRAAMARATVKSDYAETPAYKDKAVLSLETLKDYRATLLSNGERRYLKKLMDNTKWDISESCQISGLSRPRLYALLKKHDIRKFNRPNAKNSEDKS